MWLETILVLVEFEQGIVFGLRRRIELSAVKVRGMTFKEWSGIAFCAGIGGLEQCMYLLELDEVVKGMFMTVGDDDGNMFGTSGEVVGIDGIDHWLAVLKCLDGSELLVAKVLHNSLGVFDSFDGDKDGVELRHGGVAGNRRLGFGSGMDRDSTEA